MGIILPDRGQRGQIEQVRTKMQPVEVKEVDSDTVACEGIGGALGHPKVYLTFDQSGEVECPYCSRHFVRKKDAKKAEH